MANEKVDVVIVGAGASGTLYASVLAKAGKKVVSWKRGRTGNSPISSARTSGAGASSRPAFRSCSKARILTATPIRPAGASAARRCIISRTSRAICRTISRSRASTTAGSTGRSTIPMSRPITTRSRPRLGVSGDAKAEEIWRPKGEPYPMPPMKTFKNGEVWKKGCEAVGIRMVPAAVGMNSTEFKGRPACIYDGWCHVGCPIGALANPLVTYLADAKKAGAEVRAHSTVTRVLHQRRRQQGDRRRILRRQEGKAGAGGERRHPRRLGGAEPAPDAQTPRPTSTPRVSPIRAASWANT